jgi:hypothetical protein
MKKVLNLLPFLLMFLLTLKSFLITPSIAESIMLIALAGLCAYRFYFMEKETPDYIKIFSQKIESITSDYNSKIVKLAAENKELRENYAKVVLPVTNKTAKKFEF